MYMGNTDPVKVPLITLSIRLIIWWIVFRSMEWLSLSSGSHKYLATPAVVSWRVATCRVVFTVHL